MTPKSICFIGLQNLPVLAREFNEHAIGGEEVQHTLLAKALAARGYRVSMVTADFGQQDGAEWNGIKVFKAYKPKSGLPGLRFFSTLERNVGGDEAGRFASLLHQLRGISGRIVRSFRARLRP